MNENVRQVDRHIICVETEEIDATKENLSG